MSHEGHTLYTPADFTSEEYGRANSIALLVIDDGFRMCKKCGAGNQQLDDYKTCADYRDRPFPTRIYL